MALFFTPLAAQTPVPLPFDHVSSVIYDKEDYRDAYTDEYLITLSHLGSIRLQGIITTYAPNEREYPLFVTGRQAFVAMARAGGQPADQAGIYHGGEALASGGDRR